MVFRVGLTALFFFLGCSLDGLAQFFAQGSRSSAMGGAASTLSDIWAVNNNPGALGFLDRGAVGLHYENRFLLPETGTYGLQAAYPFKKIGVFGIGISRFGYRLFNRNAVGIRYAKHFGPHISAGIGMNYHYIFIGNGYGNSSAVSAEAGVLGRINKELTVAFHLVNPARMRLTAYQNQRLPMLIRFGLSYLWARKVLTALEADVDPEQKPNIKFGVEYTPVSSFLIRAGFSSRPLAGTFGFGMDYKGVRLDVSAAYHQQFGVSPQASFSYSFGRVIKYPDSKPKTARKATSK
jgi:hypothetical protein